MQMACSPRTKAVLTARCRYRTILLNRKAMYVVNCRLVGKLSAEDVYKPDSQSQIVLELVRLCIATTQLQAIRISNPADTNS